MMKSEANTALALAERLKLRLDGHPAQVQGATLAQLLAIWLAGHVLPGRPELTEKLREELLLMHVESVRRLVPLVTTEMGTTP